LNEETWMWLYNISILYLYARSVAQVISIHSDYHKDGWCNSNILDLNSVGGTLFRPCPVYHLSILRLFMVSPFCKKKMSSPSQCYITPTDETEPLNNIITYQTMLLIIVIYLWIHLCIHREMFIHVGALGSSWQ
jgi:hypothetical protein